MVNFAFIMERLLNFYEAVFGAKPVSSESIDCAGSSRRYFRIDGVIGTIGTSRRENEAFVYLSDYFNKHGLPVPAVSAVSDDGMCYFQNDLGSISLYSLIASGHCPDCLLDKVMELLPRFHYCVDKTFDSSKCFPRPSMDVRSAMWDLNYFKYSFLRTTGIDFDEDLLENDMQEIAKIVSSNPDGTLILRDFQSRNVMVCEGNPFVIDFQGARLGDGLYDVASFAWQARAGFSDSMRSRLVEKYRKSVIALTGCEPENFYRRLDTMVLFRTLQVLGAYGFRGYFERKAQFLVSINQAVENLHGILCRLSEDFVPYFQSVLRKMAALPRFKTQSADGLTVTVMSFSYKKGMPEDMSGNGGGFVFDCRGMHNPGRYDCYKPLTGRDRSVIEFLEEKGEILQFMDNCFNLVDPSVECYIRRGFTDLMVCFGCTGGQHRSVYGAEHMAMHIKEKFGIRVHLIHREQNIDELILPE